MDFDRLDSALQVHGISRRKLALEVGIAESTMSSAFMRRSGLSFSDTLKIAEYLSMDPYWLEGYDLTKGMNGDIYYSKKDGSSIIPITESESTLRRFNFEIKPSDIEDKEHDNQAKLNHAYNKLNQEGRLEAVKRIEELTEIPRYTKPDNSEQ